MFLEKQTLLQFNNISLKYSDQSILTDVSGSISRGDKIGFVGINGSGKSTLLKCIAGQIKPQAGMIDTIRRVVYLPQLDLDLYRREIPLYQYLEEQYEDWWQVLIEYEQLFHLKLNEAQMLNSLSGGELVKLNIAIAITKSPDVLLLDEPTNHLDLSSLVTLEQILKEIKIAFIIISHNINFLNNLVENIWELSNGKLTFFGGNYDFYQNQKGLNFAAKQRIYQEKQKELKKLIVIKEREIKRAARSQKVGTDISKKHDRSTDGFATGYFKNRSEKSGATKNATLETKEKDLVAGLEKLKITKRKNIYLELNAKQKSGLILAIENGNLILPNLTQLLSKINLRIYHGSRMAIIGDNGSGKTTLAKQLTFNNHALLTGKINYGSSYSTLCVDQKYDLINPDQSLIANLQENNPKLNYQNVRRILANLGFSLDYNLNVQAKTLSGGETARLAFALATSANIDMLVLDEPTNNLDIETVTTITEALKNFAGTLIAISHDLHFLEEIGINHYYHIKNQQLIAKMRYNIINYE